MTKAQRALRALLDRQSADRQKMAELAAVSELSDEQRGEFDELERGVPDLERKLRQARREVDEERDEKGAAETRDDKLTVEQREFVELRGRTSIGRIFAAGIKGQRLNGADEEFRQAAGADERTIPYALFEERADSVTGAPSTVGVNMDQVVPKAFAASVAEFLGVTMPRVPSGTHAVPRLTTSLTAAAKAKSAAAESSEAAFTVANATPKRLSARLSVTAEDIASAGIAQWDAALRANLMMVLGDALDVALLRGTGADGQISGLAGQLTDDTAQGSANTFANGATDLAGYLDGLFACELSELKVIHNAAVYSYLATLFATADDSVSFLQWAKQNDVMQRCNSNMSASTSDVGESIVVRSGAMARGVSGPMAECPIWADIAITDPYSESAKATTHVTLHALIGDVIVRYPSAYAEWRVKTA